MTLFAKIGQSPAKRSEMFYTPRGNTEQNTTHISQALVPVSLSLAKLPDDKRLCRTKMARLAFLIDFTQQIESVGTYRPASPAKSATESNLLQYINSQRSPQ